MFSCKYCNYSSSRSFNVKRHEAMQHLSNPFLNKNQIRSGYIVDNIQGVFDIRLKENFKLFLSGPSRCGKTVFVAKLIENIQSFAKQPPTSIIYVYKVWQDKYDEMESLGDIFFGKMTKYVPFFFSVCPLTFEINSNNKT